MPPVNYYFVQFARNTILRTENKGAGIFLFLKHLYIYQTIEHYGGNTLFFMKILLVVLMISTCIGLSAQADSVILDKNFSFTNGVYCCFNEMLQNSPRHRDAKFEIREGPLKVKTLYFYNDDAEKSKYKEPVFAIVQNGRMSLNFDYGFHKLILLGSISTFFIEHKTVNPGSIMSQGGWGTHEPGIKADLYFLDLKTGNVGMLQDDSAGEILKRDSVLYAKYSKVSRSKRKKMLYSYVLEYNARNPTYIK